MKWSDSIPFSRPLRDVRLLTRAPLQEWSVHVEEREQAAYERGRHDGERALSEQLIQQRNEMVELQQGVVDSLRRVIPHVVQEGGDAIVNLALEAAKKMVAGLPVTVEMIEAVVREALQEAEDTAEITVQLHVDDLALLRKHDSPMLKGALETASLRFAGSSEVTRGGCILQTRFGLIDARRETKIDQLRQSVSL